MEYRVGEGESLFSISAKLHLKNYRAVWDAPENEELRKKRPNPNVLEPGDRLFIPGSASARWKVPTGNRHSLEVVPPRPRLRLRLIDALGQPFRKKTFQLTVESNTIEGQTTDDGHIDVGLPASAARGDLVVDNHRFALLIGELRPIDTHAGQQQRLQNLNYYDGAIDGSPGIKTCDAMARFQLSTEDLDPTAKGDHSTLKALAAAHDGNSEVPATVQEAEEPPPSEPTGGEEPSPTQTADWKTIFTRLAPEFEETGCGGDSDDEETPYE